MDRRIVYLPVRGTAIDAHVGMRLARLRVEAGLTLGQMAALLHLTIGKLVLIETGDRRASAATLIRACVVLGVPSSALYEGWLKPSDNA